MPKPIKSKRQLDTFDDEEIPSRSAQLCNRDDLQHDFTELYKEIEKGFEEQSQRSDDIADYWDCYNSKVNHNQYYAGVSQAYVPIVYDAVEARKTRFINQIFPQTNRYLDVTSEDGKNPHAIMSLLESYIRAMKLHTEVIPELIKSGDIEGQYTVYVDWERYRRDVVYRVEKPRALREEGELDIADPLETVDDIEEEVIVQGLPTVEVISDCDLLVLPVNSKSLRHALNEGGSVTVIRRWSKAKIKQKIKEGDIDKTTGELLIKEMSQTKFADRNIDKRILDAAGIKSGAGGSKYAQIYETWTKLDIDGEVRLYKIYFGGPTKTLSCKRNPLWSDNLPIVSCSINKTKGSFKGRSKVAPVASFQYIANDAVNMGMDSAHYALMPIVMTNPEKNPNIGSMILNMAAIWMTSPQDTQIMQFPALWKDALEIVASARAQIFQSLSVNPAAITQNTTIRKKLNQAEIANEHQIDILTTADAVSVIEQGILTPMVHLMLELDHQYRDKKVTILQHGKLGIRVSMQEVDPISMHQRHYICWRGVEAARNVQRVQQQIAAANILRGIPPQLYQGYKLNLVPIITLMVENAFGPQLAPEIFEDVRDQLSIDPEKENEIMISGIEMPVSQFDNPQQHMQAHMQAIQETGDTHGTIRAHIQQHQMQVMQMMQAAMQQGQPGMPGTPGGAGKGIPGQPRGGAQPGGMRNGQMPPGAIHQDRMSDAQRMPR